MPEGSTEQPHLCHEFFKSMLETGRFEFVHWQVRAALFSSQLALRRKEELHEDTQV